MPFDESETFSVVPFKRGWRVMSSKGTFFSDKSMSKRKAQAQAKALYAAKSDALKGDGLFDSIVNIASRATSAVKKGVETVKKRVQAVTKGIRNDYPPASRETIAEYGDGILEGLYVRREPIQSMINKALDFITRGRWSDVKKELHYDNMFHLGLVATVSLPDGRMVDVLMEKNEVINITTNFSTSSNVARMSVPIDPAFSITLREFLMNAQRAGGADYFKYDAFTNNCQMFIMLLLDSNDLSTPFLRSFILQDAGALLKRLPAYTSPFARTLTNIAGLASVAMYGEGQDVVMKPQDYFAEHKKLVELLNDVSSRLSKEAKEQASEAKSMKKKLEGKSTKQYGGVRLIGRMVDGGTNGVMEGDGISSYTQRRLDRMKEYGKLTPEQKAEVDKANQAEIERRYASAGERKAKFEERDAWNAEMKRQRESPLGKFVDGLVKVGDFASDVLQAVPGVGRTVANIYQTFAPPGSKYAGGRKKRTFTKKLPMRGGAEMCGCGKIRSKFQEQLKKAGIDPNTYLDAAKAAAKKNGYDPRALEFSDNDIHKLMIYDDFGKAHRFGRVGYGDFIIWSRVDPPKAPSKRSTFRKSHEAIKGDWKKDKYSPNNLAINILW